jgi:hypothetical protein
VTEQLLLGIPMDQRAGWRRLRPPGNKLDQQWEHIASGAQVIHCGHPTALRPWYCVDAEGKFITQQKFRLLSDAKARVDRWHAKEEIDGDY